MNSQKKTINGGFPPIRYCYENKENSTSQKERFFASAPRQNINIRQLLSDSVKKPIIITEDNKDKDNEIEVAIDL